MRRFLGGVTLAIVSYQFVRLAANINAVPGLWWFVASASTGIASATLIVQAIWDWE